MSEWEYATIWYGEEASLKDHNLGQMIWSAQIKWPGADQLDLRDEVRIEDVLNDVGREGWELVSETPAPGINARELRLKRPRP
ncbi:MAG TPA: hypothetical protein VMS11_04230 [Solirubrobacterales bacterium]|nr:hypothetical protein [Solirubrobacterales bacterium]